MKSETRERLGLGLQMEEDWVWERGVGKHILVVVNRKFVFPLFFFFKEMYFLSQVFVEIHKWKSASIQDDWAEQLCCAL